MSLGFVFGLLIAAVGAVGAGLAIFNSLQSKKKGASPYGKAISVVGIILIVAALIGFMVVPQSFHTVEAGEIAVVKHLGEATKVRTAGTYFDFWLTESYDYYDAKVQNMSISTHAYSKDAQTMDITMSVQYQIDTTKAIQIANQYGSIDLLSERIEYIATEKTKATLSSYSAMNIIETRSTISPEVEEVIKKAVSDEYCVNIIAVVLTNIDFSDAFEKTVEDKMIAEQEKLKAEYEKETAIVNAEKELEVAKLRAQAVVEESKANAQAVIEVAKAESQSIKLRSVEAARALGFKITETEVKDEEGNVTAIEYNIDFEGKSIDEIELITEYLKYIEYLAKWDGKLPTVMTGDSANIMIPTNP